jgi:NADH dehydrogenase/NADH:ubiquinone oxidoreductase subunit G
MTSNEIILNNKKAVFKPGETILSAARRQGIRIPTLCSHEALAPYGACRLCIVEVEHAGKKQILTSCTTLAQAGMKVKTSTARIQKIRATLAGLLLSRSPEAPVVQQLARDLGVRKAPFTRKNDLCIMCGLCVRTCREVVGAAALGFTHKGSERQVGVPFYRDSQECIGCGACVFVCPTGAVRMLDAENDDHKPVRIMENWETKLPLQQCAADGMPFAPKRMLEHFARHYPVPEGFQYQCPECRRENKKT